jgi:deoxyribose-phosphate aldolase
MQHIARCIEHTLLSPTLSDKDIDQLVLEAKTYGFCGVCVPPFWVKRAQREIDSAAIQLVTVVGFPLGYQMTETKLEEARLALRDGAAEIDMVMNISAFKMNHPWFKIELAKMARLVHDQEAILKVIIETAYLTDEEIVKAATIAKDAGADFVKTSTGFANAGARVEHIKLLRETLPSHVGIKASGGIKTLEQTLALIKAGADRIGTSSGVAIVSELSKPS